MEISIRNITFTISRTDGSVDSFTKEIAGDNEMVQWAVEQIADVNQCGCTAQYLGKQIAIAGNIQ